MTKSMAVSNLFKSKTLVVVLVLGNLVLALTTIAQGEIIQGQKRLIQLLYEDTAALNAFRVAEVLAKNKARLAP
jgi:hypothetical protein